ncbi:MAG: D-alanine--D-alanine ligase [Elusimicrobiota bacterium]
MEEIIKRKKINVAVFFGGESVEHEVSIQSAKNIINELKNKNEINLIPIFVDKEGKWHNVESDIENIKKIGEVSYNFSKKELQLNGKKAEIDIAFSLIHGNIGEDGKIQGLFEIMNVAYTGSDLTSSAIAMNKKLSKILAAREGVPVLDDMIVTKNNFLKNKQEILKKIKKIKLPIFVKPVSLGSSVGVSKVSKQGEMEKAILNAFKYEDTIMVEKGIERAREIVCGILGSQDDMKTSPCGEIRIKGKHEFYDYSAKYIDNNAMELDIPANIDIKTHEKIQEYSKKVFKSIGCYGFARVDFLMDLKNGKIYFCEINTIPGFTSHSLFPKLWQKAGVNLKEQLKQISLLAIERQKIKSKFKKTI